MISQPPQPPLQPSQPPQLPQFALQQASPHCSHQHASLVIVFPVSPELLFLLSSSGAGLLNALGMSDGLICADIVVPQARTSERACCLGPKFDLVATSYR